MSYKTLVFGLAAMSITIASAAVPHDRKPLINFGMVLFPGFEALDAFGPLDVLNLASVNHTTNVYVIAESLSPVGTKASPPSTSAVVNGVNISVVPTHTFANAPPLDVLMVPGGMGTRVATSDSAVDFIRARISKVKYLFTVCTGSALAAKAGVLDGRRATTNKAAWTWATAQGPKVDWVSHARWVDDGNIWTTSGVSAGIDGFLAFFAAKYTEAEAAQAARMMEYTRWTNASYDPFADIYGIP